MLIKPDGVQRGIVGKIITRAENAGLRLGAMKFVEVSEDLVKLHYASKVKLPMFPSLVKYMQSGPVIAMVWEGEDAVKIIRNMAGAMRFPKAGTIRGDFC